MSNFTVTPLVNGGPFIVAAPDQSSAALAACQTVEGKAVLAVRMRRFTVSEVMADTFQAFCKDQNYVFQNPRGQFYTVTAGGMVVPISDANAGQTDSLTVSLLVAMADANATQNDVMQVGLTVSMNESNATQSDSMTPAESVPIADFNATQVDALVSRLSANMVDSNAGQTDVLAPKVRASLADANAGQTDALTSKVRAALVDANPGQTDTLSAKLRASIADANAGQTDVLAPKVRASMTDSNASQGDSLVAKLRATILDSNVTQGDALVAKIRATLADSNAAQTDALLAKIRATIADSNATQGDTLVAKLRATIADSNAAQTDSLVVNVVFTWPPTGSLYAWRADLGITGGPTPIVSWTDQVVGKVLTSTGWNKIASDANFGNQASLQSTGVGSFLAGTLFSPAIPPPYWFWFVARSTQNPASDMWDQGPTTTALVFGGGNVPNGQLTMVTNAFSLGNPAPIDTRSKTAGAAFVGGAGQTSKIFISAQTPVATQANAFTDGTIVNNSSATVGNRIFDDRAVTAIAEFGIANNTFNVSSWLTYTGSRYGITIGP